MGFFTNLNNSLNKQVERTRKDMERKARTLSNSEVEKGLRNARTQGNSTMESIFQAEANRRNL